MWKAKVDGMRIKHLGNGIILFENAFVQTEEETSRFLKNLVESVDADSYAPLKDGLKNSGGYEFDEIGANKAPLRYQNVKYHGATEQDILYVDRMDQCLIACLVKYCKIFPTAIETVKWKTNGYAIRYIPGQYIGPHSDCALPYNSETGEILSSFPLYNTITSSIILNDSYTGGSVLFRQWGISVNPGPGSVLMYSSSYMGCHEVLPIETGERFAYLSWFGHGGLGGEQGYRSVTEDLQKIPTHLRYPQTILVGELVDF
jgi:predicted 2-oxoglutarate/Fe(II)-dependent dioxygenase YbiX